MIKVERSDRSLFVPVCERRVRSDSVQSDQKSVQEEMEEETETSQDKKLPGDSS